MNRCDLNFHKWKIYKGWPHCVLCGKKQSYFDVCENVISVLPFLWFPSFLGWIKKKVKK